MRGVLVLGLLLCGPGATALHCQAVAARTSLCALAREANLASGRFVRLSVRFQTDMSAHSFLWDQKCPSVRMALMYPETQPWDKSVEQFATTIGASLLDPAAGNFLLDISGTFRWRPDESLKGALVIDRVWSVTPTKKTAPGKPR